MENASKALIIAGAILIAILLIGIGMFLYQAAQQPISEAGSQMDEQAIRMFNSKFENYDGKQKGTSVKALISEVITSNSQNEDSNKVTVSYGSDKDKSDSTTLSKMRSSIVNSRTYTVKINYTGALVTGVEISDGTESSE